MSNAVENILNSVDKQLYEYISAKYQLDQVNKETVRYWQEVEGAALTDPVLKDLLDRVKIYYALRKPNG